ncbi:DUF6612 family protein [Lysinibacillus sp. NPDC096418]|uniref:DUF6612 family protein n=1 Tax=Lysinibacillus sp. NPDC096418 TaxID=3364138 RepID=UPI00380DB65E
MKHKKNKFYTTSAVALAVTAMAVVPASAASPFSDVSEDHPHFKGISTLSKAGVINGYNDGTFKPAQAVTRGQAAKIIVNAFELAAADSVEKQSFKDLNKSSEYYESITKLTALGVVKGYDDNTFRPNETVTRGQLAVMIARALNLNAKGTSPYTDVPEGSPYANAVTALYEAGISKGISATEYGVNDKVTRGQLATFIVNAMTTTPTVSQPSSLPLEEVFNKALAKQQDIKSMKTTMTMTQAIEVNEGKETFKANTSTKMLMDVVIDPMQFFVEGTVAMTEPESGEAMEMPLKMYMTAKDGMYMYEATEGAWIKFPSDMFNSYNAILDQAGVQASAADQLEMLKEFAKDFTLKETDNSYILTLNADGEKFNKLIKDQVSALLPMMETGTEDKEAELAEEQILASLSNMSFDNVKYQLTIDKKSFDIKNIVMDMTLAMTMEDVKMKIDQKSNITYDEFNTIKTITIPQDVLKNAKELPAITVDEKELVSTITLPILK